MMIEVLVAILLFSIGLVGLIGLQTATIQNSTDAENRSIAASLSNELVTNMWLRKTADPTNAGLASDINSWKNKVTASDLPNASGTVERNGGVTSVIVQYKRPSKSANENFNRFATQVVIP